MTAERKQIDFSFLEPFRRYVPLAAWVIVLLTILAIPLKVISYGYLPADDALRHAAKAVSGKSWDQILVLGHAFKIDPNLGWHFVLGQVHRLTDWGAEPLVIFSVVTLFVISSWAVLPWFRRPEAWLAALTVAMIVSDLPQRFLLGRPFALTITVLATILLAWNRHDASPPKWWNAIWMTALISFLGMDPFRVTPMSVITRSPQGRSTSTTTQTSSLASRSSPG